LFFGFLFPQQGRRDALAHRWEESREGLGRLHALKRAELDLEKWKELLPQKREFSKAIASLADIAKRHRVAVPSISYQQVALDQKGFSKVSFSFTVSGRYEDIRRFIYTLETSKGFLIIEDMVLETSSKSGARVEIQMKVSAFLIEARDG
jgi:Tfp pilus assembly protein PilO